MAPLQAESQPPGLPPHIFLDGGESRSTRQSPVQYFRYGKAESFR